MKKQPVFTWLVLAAMMILASLFLTVLPKLGLRIGPSPVEKLGLAQVPAWVEVQIIDVDGISRRGEKLEDIQNIVGTLKDKNIGVIITDHNVDETLAITDRTYLLYEGKILKTGTAEDLANDEMVRRVYLGRNFELRTSPQMKRKLREQEEREREEALRALGHIPQQNEEDGEEDK